MPRKARMYLPGVPCHIIQRGNNRDTCFYAEQDYQFYLECVHDASKRYGVKIHAYVLMTNHVHFLMTPEYKDSISLSMQSVGRRYVQYINKEYCRTGTLWEGRHKSSLVDADQYLLKCMNYIELNPVRANMVEHPSEYRWSSYRCNALAVKNPLISHHLLYEALGLNVEDRLHAYQSLFDYDLEQYDINLIKNSTMFSMPTGDNHFKDQIEQALNRKLGYARRGRPNTMDRTCK